MARIRVRDFETQNPVCTCGCCESTYRGPGVDTPEPEVGPDPGRPGVGREGWQQATCTCGCGCCG